MLKGAGLTVVAVLGLVSCSHTKMAAYRDPGDGWTISYPASMHRAVFADYKHGLSVRGVVIANSAVRPADGASFAGLPVDGAAFAMLQMEGGPPPNPNMPTARFPLHRSDFERTGSAPFPSPFMHGMVVSGSPWAVYVWFGASASHSDQERVWRIVESLRFPQRPRPVGG